MVSRPRPRSPLFDGFSHDALSLYGEDFDQTAYPAPNEVLLKLTHRCQARCPYCSDMIAAYESEAATTGTLPAGRWHDLVDELSAMRVTRVTISGGEPTLRSDLVALIRRCARAGMYLTLNTNGWHLADRRYVEDLASAGVGLIVISIDSHDERVHDDIRGLPGLGSRARLALDNLSAVKQSSGGRPEMAVRTILHRRNCGEFRQLVAYLSRWPLDALRISYVENDHERREWLPTREQVHEFRECTAALAADAMEAGFDLEPAVLREARRQLSMAFPTTLVSDDDYAAGRYWPDEGIRRFCDLPSRFALVTPAGRVLPCNEVEYRGGPSMGSLRTHGFKEIWSGDGFEAFRQRKCDACSTCAGPLPFQLTLGTDATTRRSATR